MSRRKHQGWIASLSNGETVFEGEWAEGEMSPWRKLLHRLKEEELQITQLQLQIAGTTVVGLPRAEGYFQAREMRKSFFKGTENHYQGIGSVVGDQIFITWMNSQGQVWQDVRPLARDKIHTTLHEIE